MDVEGYTNYIKKYCGNLPFKDVWTSSQENCKKYFSSYKFMETVMIMKENLPICMSISTPELGCYAENTDACYVRYYFERYKIYGQCDVEVSVRGSLSSLKWFEDNIIDLLLKAKRAESFEKTLTKNLEAYKAALLNFNDDYIEPYIAKLNKIHTSYTSLIDDFDNLLSFFEGTIEDRPYILKYLDCCKNY
jgi:hypothetical protein